MLVWLFNIGVVLQAVVMAVHSATCITFPVVLCNFCLQAVTEYLVLWEGYPVEDASWVAEHDITACAIRYN